MGSMLPELIPAAPKRGEKDMIRLRKLNNEELIINDEQIEYIQMIPETKIIMMNKEFHIVANSPEEVLDKIVRFKRNVLRLPEVNGAEAENVTLEE